MSPKIAVLIFIEMYFNGLTTNLWNKIIGDEDQKLIPTFFIRGDWDGGGECGREVVGGDGSGGGSEAVP